MAVERQLWIATVGVNFAPGVWEGLEAAARYCITKGIRVCLEEIANCCIEPFHGVAMMRNMGVLHALRERASHLLLIDNDVLLGETDVARMVETNKTAVVPFLDQSKLDRVYRLQNPTDGFGEGKTLVPLDWAVWSCVLLDLAPFYAGLDPRVFSDHMATGEDAYYWDYLALRNIELWQRRDVRPVLLQKPVAFFDMGRRGRIYQRETEGTIILDYEPDCRPMGDPPRGYIV